MYRLATTPQSIGGVLDSGFKLFAACWSQTFVLAALATLATAPFNVVTDMFLLDELQPTPSVIATVAAAGLVMMVVALLLTATLVMRIDAVARGTSVPMAEAFAAGARRVPTLFAVGVILLAVLTIGFALLIIPGIILLVYLVFAFYAAITQRLGPIESLRYSWRLVRGHWWRTAALITVISIIVGVLSMIIAFAAGILVATNAGETIATPWYINFVLSPVFATVVTPLTYSLFVTTYYDLRLRHEGGDIADRIAAATA